MTLKYKILIVLFAWTVNVNAQDSLAKTKSVGLGFSCSGAINTPDLAKTPYMFFKSNRHEFFVGLDIYSWARSTGTIFGQQAGYKFYIREPRKKFKAYIACNIQYVQFGQGAVWTVPYHFLPTDDRRDFNLFRTQSFSNTYGLGITYDFLKRFCSSIEFSGGFNYSKITRSPTNYSNYGLSGVTPSSKTIFTPFIKIGLSFKIYKW